MYFEYPDMPFVTSDPHFFHSNIIKPDYCNRPFKNEYEMRNTMIKNYNEVVPKDGVCIFIGDIAMVGTSQFEKITAILKKLNGTKHLVLGNHDECKPFRYVNCGFKSVHTSLQIQVELNSMKVPKTFVLCHDPQDREMYGLPFTKGDILLCGHVHNLFKILPDKDTINVGVDVWNFKPISVKDAFVELERWKAEAYKAERSKKFSDIPLREEVIRPDQETG